MTHGCDGKLITKL